MGNKSFWLNCTEYDEWEDLLARFPDRFRDVYFSPEYVGLYENSLNKATCFAYTKKNKIFLYPFLIQSIPAPGDYKDISTPYGYGGPIFNTTDSVFLKDAMSCLSERLKSRNVIAEVIKFHPLLNNNKIFDNAYEGRLIRVCPTVYSDIQISDENYRWMKIYSHSNRKNIKKAVRNNVIVEFSSNRSSWEKFRNLYEVNLVENRASEMYFFNNDYFDRFKEKLKGKYVIASCLLNDEIVSSLLVIFGAEYAHCHLIGTKRDKKQMGVNNLLHHKVIEWCKNKGFAQLHIGGGRSNSDEDSLLRFKKNFSNKISEFYVGERVLNQLIYDELCEQWYKKNPNKETPYLLKYRVS